MLNGRIMEKSANAQIKEMVTLCREYIIGLTMETERRRLVAESPGSNTVRNLELAAYFTHCKLASSHVQLALRSAMGVFSKAGNHATAAVFARRLIDSNPSVPTVITQVSPLLHRQMDNTLIDGFPSSDGLCLH
jgi:coatomer protein complex subunit alpha (xenin)